MDLKFRKELEHNFLRASYEYYVTGQPSILDSTWDKWFNLLKAAGSVVCDYVDFPSTETLKKDGFEVSRILDNDKKDEVKYLHNSPMLSLEKIQIIDELLFPVNAILNFFSRLYNKGKFEATPKYDGNSMELIYKCGILVSCLTRGDKIRGFEKINKIKHIVPTTIPNKAPIVQIRGEVVIEVDLWEKKYNNPEPGKVSNARNYIGGILNRDEYNVVEIKELVFIAFDLTTFDVDGNQEVVDSSLGELKSYGLNENYEPLIVNLDGTVEAFQNMYFQMKEYRDNICPFLIDGIVVKYPEELRKRLGETSHHPRHSVAIKFPTLEVETTINDIEWLSGKNGDFSPVAILEPVELLGTIVTRCSLHNLGNIVKLGTFPGALISLKKSGEIIPMVTNVLEESPDKEGFLEYFKSIMDKQWM